MKNFLVIYYSTLESMAAFAALSDKERQAGMQAWQIWKDNHGDLITDLGSPLMQPLSVGAMEVEALPSQIISGYSMVQAENLEQAQSLFEEHPHKENGIHIFECVSM